LTLKKKGAFTLLELVIVLAVVSALLVLIFPEIYKTSLKSGELFKNEVSSLTSSSFTFGPPPTFCVNFREGFLEVGSKRVDSPYPIDSLVLPGRVVSSAFVSSYCFTPRVPAVWAVNFKTGDGYLSMVALYPTGEVLFLNLNEAQEETLKDKLSKGRIEEWFSYYL